MRKIGIKETITNRDESSTSKYFVDVDKYSPLTQEEEVICAQGIRAGDYKSFERLINSNLRFVITVAKQYQNSSIPLSDLINSGNEGLVVAAQKFDETKGFKFISYAVWWIRQSIIKSIQDNSQSIRLATNKAQILSKYKKIESLYIQEHGEAPSLDYMSEKLDIDFNSVQELLSLSKVKFISLDSSVDNSETETTYAEMLEDTESLKNLNKKLNQESLRKDLLSCVYKLPEKERYVLINVFNLEGVGEKTLEEVAKELKLSKERIRQLRDSAIIKLSQNKLNKKILVNYR